MLAQLAPTAHKRRPIIDGARPAVAAAGGQFAAVLQVFKLPLRVLAATAAVAIAGEQYPDLA